MGKLSIANKKHSAQGLKTGIFVGIGEKFSRLDLDGGYICKRYPLWG